MTYARLVRVSGCKAFLEAQVVACLFFFHSTFRCCVSVAGLPLQICAKL